MNQAVARIASLGWEESLQILHRQMYESADSRCLLWMDPTQADVFANNPVIHERRVRIPITHVRFEPQFSPYLVALNLTRFADVDVFNTSVEMAWNAWTPDSLLAQHGQPVAGWIVTKSAASDLAEYWARHCYLHRINGLTKLLRFHDPGVREWLWPMLSPAQKRQLLGPAQKVIAFGREQRLVQQSMADIPDAGRLCNPAPEAGFCLDAHQWVNVEDYATLHAAWLHWSRTCPDKRELLAEKNNWAEKTLAALRYATLYGITESEDRRLFATHALQIGDNFHTNPKLQPVWQRTRAGDFYGGTLEEVTGLPVDQLETYLKN